MMVAESIEYEDRQGKYYIDACRYLSFLEKSKNNGYYKLSDLGKELLSAKSEDRNLLIFKQMIKHQSFYYYYKDVIEKGIGINKKNAMFYIKEYSNVQSESTISRRASTLSAWLTWAINSKM